MVLYMVGTKVSGRCIRVTRHGSRTHAHGPAGLRGETHDG